MQVTREIAITEVLLDDQARASIYPQPEGKVRAFRLLMLLGAILAGILGAAVAKADSVPMGQIAGELSVESALPLAGSVPNQLAKTILYAQTQVSYAGTQSLDLSIEAVLRAISLYATWGFTSITSSSAEPIVWDQAKTAINPDATISITPSAIAFADTPVSTPEPSSAMLLLAVLGGFLVAKGYLLAGRSIRVETRKPSDS